ncbi:MAG: hypothetical protein K0S33_356 [Bacteroidetes bacterium]|nr:hypothetical protein [Bacteroidota bacterium]
MLWSRKNLYVWRAAFVIACITLCYPLFSQKKDSADHFLSSDQPDTTKLNKIYRYALRIKYEDPRLAIAATNKGIAFAKNYPARRAHLWEVLGDTYWHLGLLDSSIIMYDSLRVISERINDKAGLSLGYKNIGYSYMEKGNYQKALEYYEKSKNIEQETKDYRGLAISNNYVGLIYMKLKNYKRARLTYEETIPMFMEAGDFDNVLLTYNNIGGIYVQTDQYDSALVWYYKAYKLKNKVSKKNLAITAGNIGGALYYKKNYHEAEKYLKEAIDIFAASNNTIHIADTYYTLSMLYTDLKQFDLALKYANASLAIAQETNSFGRLQSIYESLTNIYKAKGDYKTAMSYYQKYVAYTDSLFNDEKTRIEKELAEKYDSEKKETQIELLSTENKLKDAQSVIDRKQKSYLLIILAISFALAIVLFFFFRSKSKIARELSFKNSIIKDALEEKEVLLKEIHHRVKNNLQIISSLLNLQQGLSGGKNAEEILKICESRIQSMAIIHEKLYQSDNLREIDLREYLVDFTEHLTQSLLLREKNIQTVIKCGDMKLDIDRLVPCSLVLNELIINSVKHGFSGTKNGIITIECVKAERHIKITFSDNGHGLPADFDFNKYKSLGMRLVSGLVKQIKGVIQNIQTERGACFEINFNLA